MNHGRLFAAAGVLAGMCVLALLLRALGVLHHPVHIATTGDRFPAFSAVDLERRPVAVDPSARGVVVYNIFTSWCPSCNEELPDLRSASVPLRARGVRMIGIDQGEAPGVVASFASRHNVPYPLLIDEHTDTNRLLGARIIPETVIVRDGVIRRVIVGPTTRASLLAAVANV